jgi:hypothetical protein
MQAFLKSRLTAIHALSVANASVLPDRCAKDIYEGKTLKADCFSCGDVFRLSIRIAAYAIREDTKLE